MKKILIIATIALVVVGGGVAAYFYFSNQKSTQSNAPPTNNQAEAFDKSRYSNDEPGSLWWIVNRERPLPDEYQPADLKAPNMKLRWAAIAESMQVSGKIAPALEEMYKAMQAKKFDVMLISGFRSHATQKDLYDRYVRQIGEEKADRISARPGTSEHQTGLAVDIGRVDKECELETCFGNLPEGKWLADNAHKYGFIVRYLEGKDTFTGYQYEPWHLRYVGKELAAELHSRQVTMEEFFLLQ
jgi:zinc D-Ala-D-Ala carboxypeptidase